MGNLTPEEDALLFADAKLTVSGTIDPFYLEGTIECDDVDRRKTRSADSFVRGLGGHYQGHLMGSTIAHSASVRSLG
jgi:hypothetical protein